MEIHANRLLKLASPSAATPEENGSGRYTANWLTSASLWRITQDVIESQHIHSAKIENRLAKNLIVKGTNPMLIGRIIAKIIFELSVIKTEGDITIKHMPSSVSDGYVISFTVKNRKASGKGKASQLTAIGLRLKLFCNRLIEATGYYLQAPSLFQHDGFWEVRLPIQDILETTGDLFSSSAHGSSSVLSFREQEIVEMVRSGYDNNDISSSLGITHATVKQHLKAIYRKLGVNNRIDLIFK